MWWLSWPTLAALLTLQLVSCCRRNCRCSPDGTRMECTGSLTGQMTTDALTTLIITGFEMRKLDQGHLNDFVNLESLTLAHGRISEIAEDTFRSLLHLKSVNLSSNEIVEMPVDSFASNKQMQRLVLSGNPLQLPLAGPMLRSESLELLDLSDCSISSIGQDTFVGLPNLRELHLENNLLVQKPVEALAVLKKLQFFGHDTFVKEELVNTLDSSVVNQVPISQNGLTIWQIAMISSITIVIVLVMFGVYKAWGYMSCVIRRNRRTEFQQSRRMSRSNGLGSPAVAPPVYAEIASGDSFDNRGAYRPVSQRELLPPLGQFPGYVYHGCECPRPPSSGHYSCFLEDVDIYSPSNGHRLPSDRLPMPPPYPRDMVDWSSSRQQSVTSGTQDSTTQTEKNMNLQPVPV